MKITTNRYWSTFSVALVILLGIAPANACHRFARWHYLFPQRCSGAYVKQIRLEIPLVFPPERTEIPLPTLDWSACPDGDDRLRGIAKLRALGENR